MRALCRILLVFGALGLLVASGVCGWVFVYSADLPDINYLMRFAPDVRSVVSDPCLAGPSTAVPSGQIGKQFQAALASAEPNLSFSDQIARTMMCNRPERIFRYQLNAFRLGWHIRRRFSEQQLFTIYVNRACFAPNTTGLENASEQFFHKGASELRVEEAALLAALQRAPESLSPFKHADRALQRRNAVLEAMAAQGKLTSAEAARAKENPIITVFSADQPEKFPLSVSPQVLRALLKTKQAPWGLAFASDEDVQNPAQLYRAAEVMLGSSGEVDLIVLGIPPMSGADNDWFWIIRSPRTDPKVILFAGCYSLELSDAKTNGYRDIRSVRSSASETVETLYHFDGTKYKTFRTISRDESTPTSAH